MNTDAAPKVNAKELLDTMLGYLGFVVQIEETKTRAVVRRSRFTLKKRTA